MFKLLFDVVALHKGTVRELNAIKARRERHNLRSALDTTHLRRTGRLAHAKALGNRNDRVFQALGRMHGHDAHCTVALFVECARRLLARQEAVEGERNGARGIAKLGLRLGYSVERLEHVGGNGLALGASLRQTHKPARGVDHITRDGGEGITSHAAKRVSQHLASARHQRQVLQARHIEIAHDARVDIATRRLARLLIELGRQRQELLGTQRKHRRGQQWHEALRGIGRVGKRTDQGTHRLHFGCLGKDRAARDNAVEPLIAEGLCIDIGVGHATQQQHHAALGLPGIGKCVESFRNRTGLCLCALLRSASSDENRLTTRSVRHQRVLASVARLKVQKALHQATVVTVKNARHIAQHLVVAAEVAHKFDELASGGIGRGGSLRHRRQSHFALLATEHLDLRATEAIDRLLRIAHGAQRALARARQIANQVHLHLVGVLELVDHDHLKAALVRGADGRVIAQCLVGHAQQVVVIESGLLGLERAVLRLHGAGQAHQRIERRAAACQHDIDKRIGRLGLKQLNLFLGKRLARPRHGARHHESRRIPHRFAARFERVDGIERHLRFLGRSLART